MQVIVGLQIIWVNYWIGIFARVLSFAVTSVKFSDHYSSILFLQVSRHHASVSMKHANLTQQPVLVMKNQLSGLRDLALKLHEGLHFEHNRTLTTDQSLWEGVTMRFPQMVTSPWIKLGIWVNHKYLYSCFLKYCWFWQAFFVPTARSTVL